MTKFQKIKARWLMFWEEDLPIFFSEIWEGARIISNWIWDKISRAFSWIWDKISTVYIFCKNYVKEQIYGKE